MDRGNAIRRAEDFFDNGSFFELLAGRIAYQTESKNKNGIMGLRAYLTEEIIPYLEKLDFTCRIVENPVEACPPFLIAQRIEDERLPTVLTYGHGDTVPGMAENWRHGLSPWKLSRDGERWYGRGTADNKGQHTINLAALGCLLEERGSLGFNVTVLMEMGEELGSPGVHDVCLQERNSLEAE
jgi:acetylornithine deacetylase/succinyl-diaminopimelate desuccinylase-like protein